MESVNELRKYLDLVNIVSNFPGRMRIKFQISGLTFEDIKFLKEAAGFEKVLQTLPGVRNVRINKFAFSCIIEYDTKLISKKSLTDLIDGKETSDSSELISELENKFRQWRESLN